MYAFSSKSGSEPFRALGDLTWNDPVFLCSLTGHNDLVVSLSSLTNHNDLVVVVSLYSLTNHSDLVVPLYSLTLVIL